MSTIRFLKSFRTHIYVSFLALGLAACAAHPTKEPPLDDLIPAVPVAEPAKPVQIVEVPKVLPMPGQLKPVVTVGSIKPVTPEARDPQERIVRANTAARVEPSQKNYLNATQVWPFSADALYQIYASPERITDIALQEGEELVSVSAGDTVRWVIGDTTSGGGTSQRVHILVKPSREDLKTNLVINTNRRTYHLELTATTDTWMASVTWDYPLDQLLSLKNANQRAEAATPRVEGLELSRLNFRYEITGDSPSWKPLRAFDDGEKVYIQFPSGIAQGELPPLFVVGNKGDAQLVNYRTRSPYYIVDQLFTAAELRLGGDKSAHVVRISRTETKSAAR
ncbi:MAG TPA: P-type conjugative transfer protein TrbG [Steroidobacteraceae bacterium]|nr:P-type conjugative transfer protein TrbG [Steroidobacteraceae bacterium]